MIVTILNTAHQFLRQGLPFAALLRQCQLFFTLNPKVVLIRFLRHNSTIEEIKEIIFGQS
jgi:hypothetical protein